MAKSYIRVVSGRAVRQAWCTVIAHSWSAWVTKLASTSLLLLLAYAYVHSTKDVADDRLFSDHATVVGLAVASATILVFGVFLAQLLFVAPYQLWKEEKERADALDSNKEVLEIHFDETNPNAKFWSTESMWSEVRRADVVYWEYRIEVKNNSAKTLRNVRVTTEHTGMMPVRPYDQEFDNPKSTACDIQPWRSRLVPILKWTIPVIQEGMLAGDSAREYGPIKVVASADDVAPATRIFHFDYQRTPMVFEE